MKRPFRPTGLTSASFTEMAMAEERRMFVESGDKVLLKQLMAAGAADNKSKSTPKPQTTSVERKAKPRAALLESELDEALFPLPFAEPRSTQQMLRQSLRSLRKAEDKNKRHIRRWHKYLDSVAGDESTGTEVLLSLLALCP